MKREISELALERYRLGEGTDAERRAIEERLAKDHQLRERLSVLQADAEAFTSKFSMLQLAAEAEVRASRRRLTQGWLPRLSWGLAGCMAAGLLALVFVRSPELDPHSHGKVRLKGALSSEVIVKREDRQWKASRDDILRAGDQLRFVVVGANSGHVYLLSRDSGGQTALLSSSSGQSAEPLRYTIPGAYQLDGSGRQESFFIFVCSQPRSKAYLVAAAEEAFPKENSKPVKDDGSCQQLRWTFAKVSSGADSEGR